MRIAEDDSPLTMQRLRRAAVAGAAGGAALGLLVGLLLHHTLLGSVAVVLAGLIGAALSAVLAMRFGVVEWEPGEGHPHVGAKAPDDDLAQS